MISLVFILASRIYLARPVHHVVGKLSAHYLVVMCWLTGTLFWVHTKSSIYISFRMQLLFISYLFQMIDSQFIHIYTYPFNYINSRTHQLYVDKFKCYFQEIEMLGPSRSLGLRETLGWAPWSPLSRLHCSFYIELFIHTFLLGFCYVFLWTHCIYDDVIAIHVILCI